MQEWQGWKFPEGVEALIKIGNFPISVVAIDPITGIVHQYADASMEAVPVHADVSSLAKDVGSFVEYVENCTRDDDAGDEDVECARRKREVDAIYDAIRPVDPLPFVHECSEWVEKPVAPRARHPPSHCPQGHRVRETAGPAPMGRGEDRVLAGCRLHRCYERKAEHFPAFVGTAATLIGYRPLNTLLTA